MNSEDRLRDLVLLGSAFISWHPHNVKHGFSFETSSFLPGESILITYFKTDRNYSPVASILDSNRTIVFGRTHVLPRI